jgi:23S rRNA (guanine745-N1)-methyltransferase
MARSYLACTVRGCCLPLERRERAFVCSAGHSFDIARSGYVNVLQPQDRRSPAAGDSSAVVESRAHLLDAGIGRAIIGEFAGRAARVIGHDDQLVVELGSGSGELLAMLAAIRPIEGLGIDISVAAAEYASRRYPTLTWLVANADRRLPLMDRSAQLVLSFNARRNAAECARVLAPGGFLLVALPAPDDLIELREAVAGRPIEQSRSDAALTDHNPPFTLVERFTSREQHRLERDALLRLLRVTYRGERRSEASRVEALTSMNVTLASEVLVFELRTLAPRSCQA